MTRREQAVEIARRVNAGEAPTAACRAVGLDPEFVYSEDSSVFDLDDPDNDMIDLGYDDEGVECLVVRRFSKFDAWDAIAHIHLTHFERDRAAEAT